ncbi:hypothetical protein GC197_10570 [bacterium]|nr:hypothetical protein [bacterium]
MPRTPEGIEIVEVDEAAIIALLRCVSLVKLEQTIAANVGAAVERNESAVYVSMLQANLEVCGMTVAELENHIAENWEQIARLATRMLLESSGTTSPDEESPRQLSAGFGISYAIYHQFLSWRTPEELMAYLQNRRVPNRAKFALNLQRWYQQVREG